MTWIEYIEQNFSMEGKDIVLSEDQKQWINYMEEAYVFGDKEGNYRLQISSRGRGNTVAIALASAVVHEIGDKPILSLVNRKYAQKNMIDKIEHFIGKKMDRKKIIIGNLNSTKSLRGIHVRAVFMDRWFEFKEHMALNLLPIVAVERGSIFDLYDKPENTIYLPKKALNN